MIEILDVKDAEPKKLDITPELAIAAYNTLIQFCKQQEGMKSYPDRYLTEHRSYLMSA